MEGTLKRTFLVTLAVSAATVVALAGEPPPMEAALLARLRARIADVARNLDGILGVVAKDITTGRTIGLNPDQSFPTASSIKLAVLYELYRQAEEGRIDLAEEVQPSVPRVTGGGVLQWLGDRVRLTWRDLAVLMMGWSDNEATNLLIRRLGLEAVNRRLDSLGLRATRLRRLMMDLEAARRGDENLSTPAEMAELVAGIARGEGLPPEQAKDLLAVATVPDAGSYFRSGLPEGLRAVSKPGSLEGVRCEVAWVDLPGHPYTAAVMTSHLRHDADGEAAIRAISTALFETFDRLARASEHGRIIRP